MANTAIILASVATGLAVANILRRSDNLVKLVGTSASIVTIIMLQCLMSAEVRQATLTVQTVLGVGLVSIATWCYHFYKQQPLPSPDATYQPVRTLDEGERGEFQVTGEENEKDATALTGSVDMKPTPFRIVASFLFVIFLAVATALFGPAMQATR